MIQPIGPFSKKVRSKKDSYIDEVGYCPAPYGNVPRDISESCRSDMNVHPSNCKEVPLP
jgi:hypothetical protein